MGFNCHIVKSNVSDQSSQVDAADEFMVGKAERKASFFIKSKGIPSAQAVNDAKLIPKLQPSDVKILKFSE